MLHRSPGSTPITSSTDSLPFEVEPPTEGEIRQRRRDIVGKGFPYLVAEYAGEVVGYAYASPYRMRPACRYTAENSVYLHAVTDGNYWRRCSLNARHEDSGRS